MAKCPRSSVWVEPSSSWRPSLPRALFSARTHRTITPARGRPELFSATMPLTEAGLADGDGEVDSAELALTGRWAAWRWDLVRSDRVGAVGLICRLNFARFAPMVFITFFRGEDVDPPIRA